jgi:hypothetical protein
VCEGSFQYLFDACPGGVLYEHGEVVAVAVVFLVEGGGGQVGDEVVEGFVDLAGVVFQVFAQMVDAVEIGAFCLEG